MTPTAAPTMLTEALRLAGSGLPIFPCHTVVNGRCDCGKVRCDSPGKHPRTSHGVKDATTDPAKIRAWWQQWPEANIGMATGQTSGVIALDIDPRHGGDKTLAGLLEMEGPLPTTVESATGSGGRHILLKSPGPVKCDNKGKRLGVGIDIKADRGYVIAAPSVGVRQRYAWLDGRAPWDIPLAPLPEWIAARLREDHEPQQGCQPVAGLPANSASRINRCLAYLTKCPSAISGEGGHDATLYAACTCFRFGLDMDDAWRVMREYNATKAVPKWTDREIEHKLKDALKKVQEAGEFGVKLAERQSNAAASPPATARGTEGGAGDDGTGLPVVLLPGADVGVLQTAIALGRAMADQRDCFDRAGVVVAVDMCTKGKPAMRPVTPAAVPAIAERFARLRKRRVNRSGQIIEDQAVCTESQGRVLLATPEFYRQLPPIALVCPCPVLVEWGGQLVQVVGYDRQAGILATGIVLPDVSLDDAVPIILDLLADFRFATPGDHSRALALMIDPAMAFGALISDGRIPAALIEADRSQAGKGLLAALSAGIYACDPYIIAQARGGVGGVDERLAQAMIEGRPFVLLDNWRGRFDSEATEAALTARSFSARAPYRAAVDVDPRRTKFLITSNGLEATEDLANRCSIIRIVKQPEAYKFRQYAEGNVLAHVEANQAVFLAAIFAVLRKWHRAGKPRTGECRHNFRGWAGSLDWIVQHVFGAAPLMEGMSEAHQRITNPRTGWLRQLALRVLDCGRGGDWLRTHAILDLMLSGQNLKVPGLVDDDDPSDDSVRTRLLQRLGRELGMCFQGDTLTIDGIEIQRRDAKDKEGRDRKEYRFCRPPSPTGDDGAIRGKGQDDRVLDTDKGMFPPDFPVVPPGRGEQIPLIESPFPLTPPGPRGGIQERVGATHDSGSCSDSSRVCDPSRGLGGNIEQRGREAVAREGAGGR